jgi:hypothetical protein
LSISSTEAATARIYRSGEPGTVGVAILVAMAKGAKGPGAATRKGRSSGRTTGRAVRPAAPAASGRYTPPVPRELRTSPPWLVPTMAACGIIGFLLIILNYLSHLLPASPSNYYLLAGIVLIAAAFGLATRWR